MFNWISESFVILSFLRELFEMNFLAALLHEKQLLWRLRRQNLISQSELTTSF